MNIFILDANRDNHCKGFVLNEGFDMLEEHVNKEIERHQHLASKIRENINDWKDQKRHKKLGKNEF